MTRKNAGYNRSIHQSFLLFLLMLAPLALSLGCGGTSSPPNCALATSLDVAPPTAMADHLAASPGNQITFVGLNGTPPGCLPTPGALRTDLKWTVSDPANVTIGNTLNVDYGTAKCLNATAGAITVTASGPNIQNATITGTAALTCK